MSFFKKLFGGGDGADSTDKADKAIETVTFEGYEIRSLKMKDGNQYRVCAEILRTVDGEEKVHKLIRADICSEPEEASEIAIRKAKQMITEQGERLFG